MKVTVNKDLCIGCGICESVSPRVFFLDADGKASAKVDPLTPDLGDEAQEAEGKCPVTAITVSKTNGRDR